MKALTKVLDWWRMQLITPEEKYLMKAQDLCDLEYRQKRLGHGYKPL